MCINRQVRIHNNLYVNIRFSASEALAHSWLKEEGTFDKSAKHLSRASKSFRIARDAPVSTDRPGHPGPDGTCIFMREYININISM
jgi:hypothetical protein